MENLKKKYKTPKLNIEVIGLTDVMASSADGGYIVVDYFDNSVYLSDEAGLFSYYKD
ncbi:MAG: hypothetical protein PUC88_05630 [Clostridia bacterium]|nr:hypothetical protein [Clostridia bacterium]